MIPMNRTYVMLTMTALGCILSACGSQNDAERERGDTAASAEEPSPAAEGRPNAFDRILRLQDVTFHVTSPNSGSMNLVTITPSGLERDNSPITAEVDGSVTGAEVADLNADGSPEIYVYVTSAGSGSYGSLAAYGANNKKSLSMIYLPEIAENSAVSQGYMGHDQFAVVEHNLVRRFPVYRQGDTNANPTGGTRQVHYRLTQGEASWVLALDSVVEY